MPSNIRDKYVPLHHSSHEILMSAAPFYLMHRPGQSWRKGYETKARQAWFHLWLNVVIFRRVTGFH